MSFKMLELYLVLIPSFKEFVEFSLSSTAQLLKLRLLTKPWLNKYFDGNLLLRTKLFDLKMPI